MITISQLFHNCENSVCSVWIGKNNNIHINIATPGWDQEENLGAKL